MTVGELLGELSARDIQLRRSGGELVLLGSQQVLDNSLVDHLRRHKTALMELVGVETDQWWRPVHTITPDMLTLVQLTPAEIARIVDTVPGGAANVQDIYPLAPLQEGILFHHLLGGRGDPYVVATQLRFDSRQRLDRFLAATQSMIARHDILRTAVVWEGLPRPLQVVWRYAPLAIEEIALDPDAGDIADQLYARVNPRQQRMDLRIAPWIRVYVARDPDNDRWILLQLRHHLAGDHRTTDLMREEIVAHLAGRADRLSRPIPFRNFVAPLRAEREPDEHAAFFEAMLADVTNPTTPLGLVDVRSDGVDIAEAVIPVDSELASRLRAAARQRQVTAAAICHVAWALVLARLSGTDDVVFGTALVGRASAVDADRAMGMFMNTLPIRIRLDSDSVAAVVQRTHLQLAELLHHEHASLAAAQRCSGIAPPRPLFSAALNYRHLKRHEPPEAAAALEGIEALSVPGEERTNYPFTLAVDDLGEGFRLCAQVASRIDPRRVCDDMHLAIERVVEALDPQASIAACVLDIVPNDEHVRLVSAGQDESRQPTHTRMHGWFETQAARTPEAPAVIAATTVTYGELNARANQLAHELRDRGAGPESIVGLCAERSVESFVGLLGILKAGAAYLPLDPAAPPDRLAFMLHDAGVSSVVTTSSLRGRLPDQVAAVVLDADRAALSQWPTHAPAVELSPRNLAYVIYTSGSTGTPKAVMVTHDSVCNLADAQATAFQVRSTDRIAQFSRLSFDASVSEIVVAFRAGAALCLLEGTAADLALELVQAIGDARIEVAMLPPSVLSLLTDAPLGRLRTLVVGGEPCKPEQAAAFATRLHFVNAYGPTETTVCSTLAAYQAEPVERLPIGRPISNTAAYVLDSHMNPLPGEVAGELYLGGIGLARGYLRRPGATAERFVANPFGPPGTRLYRTGDLARFKADGALEFLGRRDHQVRLRGFRIELGELEAALSRHPDVRDCVVTAHQAADHQELIAYVVGPPDALAADALRAHLQTLVPEYMMPSRFILLDRLPLNENGKIDRSKLPAAAPAARRAGSAAPPTKTEAALAAIWSEVLGVDHVGVADNFFELGGDSIRAIHILGRASRSGIRIAIKDLFEHQTIAALAAVLDASDHREEPAAPAVQPTAQDDRSPVVPVTPSQRWCLDALGPDADRFVVGVIRDVTRRVDPRLLQDAVRHVLLHHDALRYRFEHGPDGWRQIAPRAGDISIAAVERIDQRGISAEQWDDDIARHRARLRSSVRLGSPHLVRVALVDRDPPSHQRLLFAAHHLVVDALSLRIFFADLQTAYQQLERGQPVALPASAASFADWANQLQVYAHSADARRDGDYWRGLPWTGCVTIPLEPCDELDAGRTEQFGATLDARATQSLLGVQQRLRVSLEDVLLAAQTHALQRWTGGRVFSVALRRHGRVNVFPQLDVSRTIGWFSTTHPVVLSVPAPDDVLGLLATARARLAEVPADGLAYGVLRYMARDRFFAALTPPRILLNYLGRTDGAEQSLFQVLPVSDDNQRLRPTPRLERDDHSIALSTALRTDGLHMEWSYRTDLHQPATIRQLAHDASTYLTTLAAS